MIEAQAKDARDVSQRAECEGQGESRGAGSEKGREVGSDEARKQFMEKLQQSTDR